MENKIKTQHDQQIIDDIAVDNSKRIHVLYHTYFPHIEKFVLQNKGTTQDAEDLFQDSMLVVYEQTHQGLRLRSTFSAYFRTIYQRVWLNRLRSRKKQPCITIENQTINALPQEDEETNTEEVADQFLEYIMQSNPANEKFIAACMQVDEQTGKAPSLKIVALRTKLSYNYVRKKISVLHKKYMDWEKQQAY